MANTDLTRTTGTPTNVDKFTISVWVKRANIGINASIIGNRADGNNRSEFSFRTDDTLRWEHVDGGSNVFYFQTNRKFRDTNAWYHIVFGYDSSQGTSSNRWKLYINGVQETSFSASMYPAQNANSRLNVSGQAVRIGSRGDGNEAFDGSMSHFHFIDGTQYAASDFGSTDSTTGEWKINTSPSVTYGNNGFFVLKDGNSLTDQSPNTNNFTLNGGTLTKTEDNPSNVFATWSPLHTSQQSISNVVYKNGNTTFDNNETSSSVYPQVYSTLAASSGKYYFESKLIASNGNNASKIGISGAVTTETYAGQNAYTYVYRENGTAQNNDTNAATYTSYGVNDIIQTAVDLDNNKLYFGINGTWQNSGDPTSGSTGTGAIFTITAPSSTPHGVYHFTLGDTSSSGTFEHSTNFGNGYFGTTAVSSAGTNASGNGIFEYDVPAGYTALSTKGLNL